MKKLHIVIVIPLICQNIYSKEDERHSHEGSANIKLNYELLDFKNSKKKDSGYRYGAEIDREGIRDHIQFYYEATYTDTTNMVPKDLAVKKYTIKYQYKIDNRERLTLLYATIDDNLMEDVDGGNIFGIGYSKGGFSIIEYMSRYRKFNVYQSDLKYSFRGAIDTALIGKYIHLDDRGRSGFSKNADGDYFTYGIKLHSHYRGIHLGGGAYFGKRAFSVMKDGFNVQHHSMEFKESYIVGAGYSIAKNLSIHMRYGYHKAKEIPIDNSGVEVENLSFDFIYRF
ncbi:MAG: porin family protein [Epsilonproteobacteria bacterium]|nr:porin family protein [Campylobacterota bacterium]